jgi:hypothetical protein
MMPITHTFNEDKKISLTNEKLGFFWWFNPCIISPTFYYPYNKNKKFQEPIHKFSK